ncbi:hypothetical protein QYM36_019478 [Artemia franciscana]|uniref:Uncharacterized protein n=1 Tax=Artemia franciscana TaxID=6661 RepID=A0AA88KZB6_ARTSF|nr:hypothetical protein QYM36_019478 [Artemia franciscana]
MNVFNEITKRRMQLSPDGTTYYIPKDMCPDFDPATQAASQSQVNPQDFLVKLQKKPSFFDDIYDILKDKATFNPVMVYESINGQQNPASEFKDIEDEVEELLYHSNSLSTSTGVAKIVKASLKKPSGSKAIQEMINVMSGVFEISKQTEKRQREIADEKKIEMKKTKKPRRRDTKKN